MPNGADATYRSETQVLMMVSTADIPLPDPVVYRRDWANYRIRLGFDAGTAGARPARSRPPRRRPVRP